MNVARAAGGPASTLDPDEAAERCWPVVVVGAGPAGIALALALRRAGIDVLVIERADFPRPKACGGCLAPAALAALRSLDADAAAAPSTPTARIVLRVGERTFERSLAGGRAVDRAAFDAHLAGRFVACGGCLLTGRAVESVGPDGRVVLAGGAVVRGELVAIATGLGPGSGDRDGRRWSLGPMRGPAAGRVGLAATLPAEGIDPEGAIAMHVGAAGYVGAVRLRVPGAGEILHLGAALWSADLRAAGDPGAVVTALLEPTWPELSARLRNDPGAVRWRGAGRMNRRRTRVAGGRVVAIGDAAGYVEPFTGEGVGWAMDDGRALAREVIEHGSARAAERWSRVRSARARRRERRCRLLRPLLDRPRVLELALGAVGGGPGPRSAAGGRIVELLSGGRLGGPVRRGPPDARPAGRARPSGAGFRPIEPVLLGLGTATPPTTLGQAEIASMAIDVMGLSPARARRLRELFEASGVERRGLTVLDPGAAGPPWSRFYQRAAGGSVPTTAERMRRYAADAPDLAEPAARRALAEAGIGAEAVRHLVIVSCTGFAAPGLDHALIGRLGLRSTTRRTVIGFMGCHGAINGLEVAARLAVGGPTLLVCCELCGLHMDHAWRADGVIAGALFADAAAAAVFGEDRPGGPAGPRWRLRGRWSEILPGTGQDMGWTIGDHGFRMTLGPAVPERIERTLGPAIRSWLASEGLDDPASCAWAVHPGGPAILRAVESALGDAAGSSSPAGLDEAWSVLAGHGNCSSPTVLMILDRLRRGVAAERPVVLLAFGPGLSIEAALLEPAGPAGR